MQQKFSYLVALSCIALFALAMGASRVLSVLPDREEEAPATAVLRFDPIELPASGIAPLRLVGAWRLTSNEARAGGISGLGIDGDHILAMTDRGSVLRFAKQPARETPVAITDLPDGPGSGQFKADRDAEAIWRDPRGRGWWVAFEYHDQLWLFDPFFGRALAHVDVPGRGLTDNTGIEGLTGDGSEILAFPERGGTVLRLKGGRWSQARLVPQRRLSDAVRIDDRRYLVIERRISLAGFDNALALVESDGETFRTLWRKPLPVRWRDNLEALAAERTAGGGYRLWIASDDNFHPRLRTILLIVDVPAAALPKRR